MEHRFDVRDIRRENLIRLLNEYEGTNTKWALKYGLNPKVITQIKNDLRKMGPDIARRIDEALGKPSGWMDRAHGENEPSASAMELAALLDQLTEEDRQMFLFFVKQRIGDKYKKEPDKSGDPFKDHNNGNESHGTFTGLKKA